MISIHQIDHLYAKKSELPGGNWVEVFFRSKTEDETSITLYFDSVDHAAAFYNLVNEHQKLISINNHIADADTTEKFAE